MSLPAAALPLMVSEAQNCCCLTSAWIWMNALCHIFGKRELMMASCCSLPCWLKITDARGCVLRLKHSHCGGTGSWFLLIHSVEIKEENPPSYTVSDLISLWCSLHFQGLFTLLVNPICLHLPHLLSDFHCLPECLLTALREWAQLVASHQRWAFGRTEAESVLIHLWVTCVGVESKRDSKANAAFWSIEAIVGIVTSILSCPYMKIEWDRKMVPVEINRRQLLLWLKRLMPCQTHHVIDNKFGQIFVSNRNASPSRKMGLKMLSCLFNKVFKGEFSL